MTGLPRDYTAFAWTKTLGLSNLTWIAVLIVLLGIYVLKYTAYGRRAVSYTHLDVYKRQGMY